MSVRLLLAVVLAGALLAGSMPAIDAAQRAQADSELSRTVEAVETATSAMVRHSDPVPPDVPGATRRITVEPPPEPEDATLTIGPAPESDPRNGSLVAVRIPGEPVDRTRLTPAVRPLGPDGTVQWGGTITVTDPIELTLTYREVDGSPVIEVARGFK